MQCFPDGKRDNISESDFRVVLDWNPDNFERDDDEDTPLGYANVVGCIVPVCGQSTVLHIVECGVSVVFISQGLSGTSVQ